MNETFRRMIGSAGLLFAATCATGCMDTPPEYSAPTRVPPVINAALAYPSVTSLYVTSSSEVDFRVPFRADDAGQSLIARFVLDIEIADPLLIGEPQAAEDPRAFADQTDREVGFPWAWNTDARTTSGCHTMTAILSDATNFYGIDKTHQQLDEARITWFLWLQSSTAAVLPPNCLQQKSVVVPSQ